MQNYFTIDDIKDNHENLKPHIYKTPVLKSTRLSNQIGAELYFKAELFQVTGTFKTRGAITLISSLDEKQIKNGLIAGTGGNHGIAVAYGANLFSIDAKIIVPRKINTFRLQCIKDFGAAIEYVDNISMILHRMMEISKEENRTIIHPFDHPMITLGTASLGYEFIEQVPNLDLIIVPIGGGGLASGVAHAAKLINPNIQIFGVEPQHANSMYLSFKQNTPTVLKEGACSIADSLNSPCALPYSFSVCKQFVDDIVLVSDDELKEAMNVLFQELKLACEPACAASTAALLGPLQDQVKGKKVGLILCGSNIGYEPFQAILNQ